MAAMEDVAAADGSMADIWGRLGQVVSEDLLGRWGRGHPEPGMMAEQRNVLLVAEAATERNLSRAANAAATAQGHHDDEAERLDELDGPAAEPARVLEALRAWLVTVAAAHASTGPAPAPVIFDDTFAASRSTGPVRPDRRPGRGCPPIPKSST